MNDLEKYKRQVKAQIRKLVNGGKLGEARGLTSEYERMVPLDAEISSLKAIMAMREKNYGAAECELSRGLRIDSANFELLYSLASLAEKANNLCKASEYYKKCLSLAPGETLWAKIAAKAAGMEAQIRTVGRAGFRKRVLVGSPIRQKPEILQEFLASLRELRTDSLDVAYFFIDDNDNAASSAQLAEFKAAVANVVVHRHQSGAAYVCNDVTHHWNENLIWKVANLKNLIIQSALENGVDDLFLVDSDLVLHPDSLEHLIGRDKDIISQVFWTNWQPDSCALPQVWLYDQYTQGHMNRGEKLSPEDYAANMQQFIDMLKQPGTYEVGGLGACTVISRRALAAGVNFSEIRNVSFWGEDRHFCIRAAVLGFALYADTHYPAYHIYREKDLAGVAAFKAKYGSRPESEAAAASVSAAIAGMGN